MNIALYGPAAKHCKALPCLVQLRTPRSLKRPRLQHCFPWSSAAREYLQFLQPAHDSVRRLQRCTSMVSGNAMTSFSRSCEQIVTCSCGLFLTTSTVLCKICPQPTSHYWTWRDVLNSWSRSRGGGSRHMRDLRYWC